MSDHVGEFKKEVSDNIKAITLSKEQSTSIFAVILEDYNKMIGDWTYKAPEVIEAEQKAFLWDVYVKGRVDEKNDVLKYIEKL